jgi:hypothetical protein
VKNCVRGGGGKFLRGGGGDCVERDGFRRDVFAKFRSEEAIGEENFLLVNRS